MGSITRCWHLVSSLAVTWYSILGVVIWLKPVVAEVSNCLIDAQQYERGIMLTYLLVTALAGTWLGLKGQFAALPAPSPVCCRLYARRAL